MSNCSYTNNGTIPKDSSPTSGLKSRNIIGCIGKFNDLETSIITTDQLFAVNNLVAPPVSYDVLDSINVELNFVANGGIDDDTPDAATIAKNTAVMNEMLARTPQVVFPSGNFGMSGPITLPQNAIIRGGPRTVIQFYGGNGFTTAGCCQNLSNFTLYGDNTPGSVGITVNGPAVALESIATDNVLGFDKVVVANANNVNINKCSFRGNDVGLELAAGGGHIMSNSLFAGLNKAVNIIAATSTVFTNTYLLGLGGATIGIDFNSTTNHDVFGLILETIATNFANVGALTTIGSWGRQQAAIADAGAVGAAYVQAEVQEIVDQLNAALAALRAVGIIAT